MSSADSEQLTARVYELEATAAQLREATEQAQTAAGRLERDRQRALSELEALHSTHARLESRFFAAEGDLAAANARLERMQRSAAALEAALLDKVAALEKEREARQRTESDLRSELAAAKRRATVARRQTVSTTSHSRSTSLGRMAAFTPEVPAPGSQSPPAAMQAAMPAPDDAHEARSRAMQAQISQLTRRAKDAEARAQQAVEHAARVHAEAENAIAGLDGHQRRVEQLEHTVAQLTELNESLREDNESYQVLLQMSTIKGGLSFSNARTSIDSRASSGKCAASPIIPEYGSPTAPAAVLGGFGSESASPNVGRDLAAELGQALSLDGGDGDMQDRIAELEERTTQLKEDLRKTRYERRQLGEENKALSLYVNKILGRIMASAGGLEAVLSCDYDALSPGKGGATSFAAPFAAAQPPTKHARHGSIRLVRNTTTAKPLPPQPQPQPQLAPVAASLEPGTGDGVTSVFVPPTSPAARTRKPLPVSPLPQAPSQLQPQSPPPFSRRARSATVAAGVAPDRLSRDGDDGAATIGAASGGAWWKRMSIRLSGGWNAPEEPRPSADA
ncbi:hypothetical protein LPJ61_002675 [Coemansia biformis]|uniref:Uncharacterized protein n=1 Tax=Coemansia biformis TaxID=1286918 RepID=A0A9W7YFB0_9FUNG|nr:hypothetical protein LPJ61_002675 [Coemansia biformis]